MEEHGFNNETEPRVQIFDIPTKTLSTTPARELAPNVVRAKVEGIEGDCWIDPRYANKSPYQFGPFDEQTREHLRKIKSALDEVYPMSLEEWEDGFRRDRHPEREIAIWLHISATYRKLTEGTAADRDERGDIFSLLLSCANNPRELALTAANVTKLSLVEAEAVVASFYSQSKPEPVSVEMTLKARFARWLKSIFPKGK